MLEDVWIFQWCMNVESPGRFTSGAFGPNSDRFRQVFRGKNNVRQHPFTHSYSEIRPFKRRFTRITSRCALKSILHTQRLIALAENMPIDILRVRDDDIPGLGDGRCCRPRYYRRKRAGRRAAQPPRLAKTRATSPCAVSTSAAAACRWRLRWMKPNARRRWTANGRHLLPAPAEALPRSKGISFKPVC